MRFLFSPYLFFYFGFVVKGAWILFIYFFSCMSISKYFRGGETNIYIYIYIGRKCKQKVGSVSKDILTKKGSQGKSLSKEEVLN